ncbi:MAG TPA: hypothetical protein VL173_05845 [Vicinamibacterales bacterium]|nr:hypothetical protein [Vicinamibacterales bacterium]
MGRLLLALVLSGLFVPAARGQTPQPFPRPGGTSQPQPPATQAPPPATRPAPTAAPPPATPPRTAAMVPSPNDPSAPAAATLGVPVYPAAQFIASYDAGRGQRYYLYGSTASYMELVNYYRTQLKDKGDEVFDQPPTHMFQVGRYREETMAFPPGVTIKDWMWGGSQGYPNPKLGAQPAHFPSIIMIVPAPPAAAPAR